MGLYDQFVYTNFHELNADWLLAQMKAAKAKIDDFQAELDQFNTDYAALLALSSALTISGSNISTTKNFSAASLSGPLTGNVTGNLTGNVTGNVTGDVTGDVTGNAATATYATSAGSATTATTATNATNATYATSAGSATTATTATNAGHATTADSATNADYATTAGSVSGSEASEITVTAETDANNCVPAEYRAQYYQIAGDASHLPSSVNPDYPCLLMTSYLKQGTSSFVVQFCWPAASNRFFMRIRFLGSWQTWKQFTLS